MKYRLLLGCLVVTLLLFGASLTSAQAEASCETASLFEGWAAATTPGAPNGVIYGYVANLSAQADTLLSVSTDVADAAELHEMKMGSGDVMQMMPIEGGLQIPARSFEVLQQGGKHIMLVNLKQPLMAGETVKLMLTFENAGEVEVSVPVVDASMSDDTMGGMGSDMSGMTEATAPADMMMWPEGCAKIHVLGAWVRPAGPGTPNSAAYTLIVNLTGEDDTLVKATTAVAQSVELHEMKMGSGDVMQMTPIEGGIVIPAGGAVILQPGGKHIMLIGLTQELAAGTMLDFTLTFDHAGEITLSVPVQPPPESSSGMSMSGG